MSYTVSAAMDAATIASISTPVPAVVAAVGFDGYTAFYYGHLHVNEAEGQRVTHRDEGRSLLGCLNSGEAGDLQRISFWVLRERGQDGSGQLHKCAGHCFSPGRDFGAYIHHVRLAGFVVVRQFLHRASLPQQDRDDLASLEPWMVRRKDGVAVGARVGGEIA